MAVLTRVAERRSRFVTRELETDTAYACGFRIGYAIGNLCARFGLARAPQPSLHETTPLRPHAPHPDRPVPVHPRVLQPYRLPTSEGLDRQALHRAVACACSLPVTKRALTRVLGLSLLAELALAAAPLLALLALGSPVTAEDILQQLGGLATLALEFLLIALVGAAAAEIVLSALAVVQAALSQ